MRARPPASTVLPRRAVLGLALLAASCASEPAPTPGSGVFAPLDFSYLLPLRLNVARIEIVQRYVPSGQPPDISPLDPVQPVAALRLMAQQRLKAEGGSGRAVFVINDASLLRLGDMVTGTMSVELDIYPTDDTRAGYAQATVVRQLTGVEGDLSAALYRFTRDMMDQMNVEFEYQVRHSLPNWLLPSGAVQAPVQTAPLSGEPPGPPPPPAPGLIAPPATSPLVPPPTPFSPGPGAPVPLPPPPATG